MTTRAGRAIRLALAQMPVRWNDPEGNLRRAEALVAQAAAAGADLVALPEDFMRPPRLHAEPIPGPLTRHLAELARRHRIHLVTGSSGEVVGRRIYNTACLIDDRGRLLGCYRKRFLWWTERAGTTPGDSAPVFRTRFGRIGLAICWDLAFPEHFRDLALAGAELAICPAYWQAGDRFGRLAPAKTPRVRTLVRAEEFFIDACVGARAAENGMAVAFVNGAGRTRAAGRPDRLVGLSQIAVPFQGIVARADGQPGLLVADVNLGLARDAERVYGLREDARRLR